jgi:hypothetical protein
MKTRGQKLLEKTTSEKALKLQLYEKPELTKDLQKRNEETLTSTKNLTINKLNPRWNVKRRRQENILNNHEKSRETIPLNDLEMTIPITLFESHKDR